MNKFTYIYRFLQSFKHPRKVQEQVLTDILRTNSDSEYGRIHGFSSIRNIREFQEKVPIICYDDLEPFIKRMGKGEQNILTSLDVTFFCATSGTSGGKKLIPVTNERIISLKAELIIRGFFVRQAFKENWRAIFGDLLYICGPYNENETEAGIPCGSISGHLLREGPRYARKHMAVPLEVFNELDYDKKISEMAYYALLSDIKHMGFTSTIEVVMLFDYIRKNKEALLNRIRKDHPKRADYLEGLKEFTPKYIWPNVRLVNCFLTETSRYYLAELEHQLGRKMHLRDGGINASEGRMTIGICRDDISGFPVSYNTFMEFIDKDSSRICTLDQLEAGKRYEVLLTTYEGLYRYRTGDVVEVTFLKKNLPALKFHEREHFLNIGGELASEKELVESMHAVMKKHSVHASGFAYLPKFGDNESPRYEVLLELSKRNKNSTLDCSLFIQDVDKQLQRNIRGYHRSRSVYGRIGKPLLSIVPPGSWKEYNKKRITEAGQPKHIHVVTDPGFRENFRILESYE